MVYYRDKWITIIYTSRAFLLKSARRYTPTEDGAFICNMYRIDASDAGYIINMRYIGADQEGIKGLFSLKYFLHLFFLMIDYFFFLFRRRVKICFWKNKSIVVRFTIVEHNMFCINVILFWRFALKRNNIICIIPFWYNCCK